MAAETQLISAAEAALGLAGIAQGRHGVDFKIGVVYQLSVAPGTLYTWSGTLLVAVGSGSGASLTNITSAALAALTSGTVNATTLYRVTDGSFRDTVYIYDATSDTLHPIGLSPISFGFA